MKKFLFALLLGVFMVGTMTATESTTKEKESPDIIMSMEMPDIEAINLDVYVSTDTATDVGLDVTDNMTYEIEATVESIEIIEPVYNLYRYNANSISYKLSQREKSLTSKNSTMPDINRLL